MLAYLDQLDDAGSYQMLRKLTDDLNNSDMGNLVEEWYARRYAANGEPHARASKEALSNGRPPIEIERNRYIDNLGDDGVATEIKSISGKLSEREVEQLQDYRRMAEGGPRWASRGGA